MTLNAQTTSIISRRQWAKHCTIYVIGPGGVGKSTLGRSLAPLLRRKLIDLDEEFCDRIGNIGVYIRTEGYEKYRKENSSLAQSLAFQIDLPTVFIMSSGFMVAETTDEICFANHALVEGGYSLALMPSNDIDEATRIVVDRQMTRGFGLDRQREERKFRERFEHYRSCGDMLVISTASPDAIAVAVSNALIPQNS